MPDRTSQDVTKHNKEKAIYVLISSYYYGRRAPLRKTPPEIPDEILGGWSANLTLPDYVRVARHPFPKDCPRRP
jgi:hypothetical protein